MTLLWALPVVILVGGVTVAARLLDHLVTELVDLDLALRRLVRIGVAVDDLRNEVDRTGRRVQTMDRR